MSASATGAPAPVNRRRLTLLAVPLVAVAVASYAGSALMPTLIERRPELVLALSSVNRHLLLAIGSGVAPLAFFMIGFARLIAADPVYYILGRDFGERGRAWMGRQPGGVPWTIRWAERAFARADWLAVLLMPNNVVSLLAGMRRMRWRWFLALNAVGTTGRLVAVWYLGRAFESELRRVVDVIGRYQWWLVGALVVISMIQSGISASKAVPPADDDDDEGRRLSVTPRARRRGRS